MSTTFYSPEYTVYPHSSDYSSLKLRFGCTYDVTSSGGSVTISGTVMFQHKGVGGPSTSASTNYCGRCGIDTTVPVLDDTYSDTVYFNGKVYIAEPSSFVSTDTTTLNALSQHSSWTTVKSKSFSFTVPKKASSQSIYLSVGYGVSTTASRIRGATYKTISVPALASYAITYNANGGSGAPAAQTKYYGTAITLSSTKPTRTNYVFKNWNTKSDGTGTTYNSGASYTANAALTLYAQWYAPYTVTYNANGGTGGPTTQTKVYNINLTLTMSQPTRSGYAFVKWNTKSDGTGTSYSSGATYSTNANLTLYAIWAAVPSIGTLTAVRCDENGNQDDEGSYATVTCTWSCAGSSAITGTVTPQSGGSATAFAFDTNPSGSGTVTSVALVGSGNGMVLDTDMQYTVSATVSCTSSGVTKTATRNVILTRAFFVMDWKAGGGAVGIGRAAPENGLEVGYESVFDDDVTVLGEMTVSGQTPALKFTSNGQTPYTSYIRAYDTNTAGAGHNTVIQTGGNLFLGGGESPAALYNLVANGATDVPTLGSESPIIGTDSWMYFFSNCNTIANRQRMAFGGSDGVLEIPGNLRLVNKTELGTYYPNARANTDVGYVYGQHIRLRSREPDLDNNATSRTAQVSNVPLDVTDKDNNPIMRLTARQLTDGTVRAMLEAAGSHTGSTVWNAIYADVRKDGSQHYGVNNAANFRSDLGINNAANLTTGTLPSDRLPTVPIAKGGTGATTAAAARTNLGFTRANLAEKMHAVAIFSGLSVAKGGTLGTNTAVFDYQFFMVTSASNGYMLGYRTGSTSSSGGIRAIGGFDDGSTSYAYVCLLSVSTAGKVVNTCCSRHDLATQSGAALNITGLYGLR